MLTTPPGCATHASTAAMEGVRAPSEVAIDVMFAMVVCRGAGGHDANEASRHAAIEAAPYVSAAMTGTASNT